jgi:hypothetical protein
MEVTMDLDKMHQQNRKIPVEEEAKIVHDFEVNLVRMTELAKKYGVTRAAIWKLLNRNYVDTRKAGPNAHIPAYCTICGKDFTIRRNSMRRQRNHFCSAACWKTHLSQQSIGKNMDRYGMMLGRKTVNQYFPLQTGMIVHHVDGDEKNNDIRNLWVFACNGDHIRYHRGTPILPIFMGQLFYNQHPELFKPEP